MKHVPNACLDRRTHTPSRRVRDLRGRVPPADARLTLVQPMRLVLVALALLPAPMAAAGVVDEARQLRRDMRYDQARELLERQLDDLAGGERAEAMLLLAGLVTDHESARRLLREAAQDAPASVQRAADLELARLDYARGNYNNVRSRLEKYTDADSKLLVALAYAGLGQPDQVARTLGDEGGPDMAELLRGWSARARDDFDAALARFERLATTRTDLAPTVLLWKAECEAEVGNARRALETASILRRDFADAPEAVLVEPTLAALRRAQGAPAQPAPEAGDVVIQLGAFEERRNALGFREELPSGIGPITVDEVSQDGRHIYRVRLGPFDTREEAEAYARSRLEPLRLEWRLARLSGP